jgi:dihydrofolate reductase
MIISAIVAYANHYVIGKDNDIPWYLPEDLKWFKKNTLNHTVIMGRKCFESIGRPLPKRNNIIITRDMFYLSNGCYIAHGIAEALEMAEEMGETEAFIIGGGEIYRQSIDFYDKIYLTKVHADIEGDTFFPAIDFNEWQLIFEGAHTKDEKNPYDYTFMIYEKKKMK